MVMFRILFLIYSYLIFLINTRTAVAQNNAQQQPRPKTPIELGLKRSEASAIPLNDQIHLKGGTYWFGSQLEVQGVVLFNGGKDGADPRKKTKVKNFAIDVDCVTNAQFQDFVKQTGYLTEAELFQWSFVLENQVSEETKEIVDGENGLGRVKDSPHWMGVVGASWSHPYGPDSSVDDLLDYPAVHISYHDAYEYCTWAGRRLPTEKEWEYAARGGRVNETYPWGDVPRSKRMNIWEGEFPKGNTLKDGYLGPAPVKSFPPNDYGLYNMLGNVWEWVTGGDPQHRILRGGSFLDSSDGRFNHIVIVSTKQVNPGDSGASNIGFRCAGKYVEPKLKEDKDQDREEF
eukprot:gene6566-7070_t